MIFNFVNHLIYYTQTDGIPYLNKSTLVMYITTYKYSNFLMFTLALHGNEMDIRLARIFLCV